MVRERVRKLVLGLLTIVALAGLARLGCGGRAVAPDDPGLPPPLAEAAAIDPETLAPRGFGQGATPSSFGAVIEKLRKEIVELEVKVQAEPENQDLLYRLGNDLYMTGRWEDSIAYYERAARIHPSYFPAVVQSCLQSGRYDQAFKLALDAVAIDRYIQNRYLLHLAAERAGYDPLDLPEEYRFHMPPSGPPPEGMAFKEIAGEAGVARVSFGRGVAMEDIDGDGDYDLASASIVFPAEFYRNVSEPGGPPRFESATEAWGLGQQTNLPWGLHLVDFDGDGDLDLLSAGYKTELRLYRWEGSSFLDVTGAAGLAGQKANAWAGTWLDHDRDGDLDFFAPNMLWDLDTQPDPCRFFRNNGDGTFSDIAPALGLDMRTRIFGAAAGDYDGDGDTDLYLNGYDPPNHLFRNEGNGSFRDVTREAGIRGPGMGFVCFFTDFDNDGHLDLFATAYMGSFHHLLKMWDDQEREEGRGSLQCLYLNDGKGGFRDVTEQAGLAWVTGTMGAGVGDLDGDGFQDIYLGTGGPNLPRLEPNRLYRNEGPGPGGVPVFRDVAPSLRMDSLGGGHGVALGDLDRDGNLDLYHGLGNAVVMWKDALFLNESTAGYHWLTVHLRAPGPNTRAVGARLRLRTGDLAITREVSAPGGFGSTDTYAVELGLGRHDRIDSLEVRWPDGTTARFEDVPVDAEITIRKGQSWKRGTP